ncbi:SDR family NAD(P)-dependent oxidoreductase [Ovoidimarina sediminis]|uniref:SDR family NAD(P)-dependent oxidoreductase n=1 Tax=Ovoidimarina sediminis TaxID=3079856 RepID=UPI0029134864|nr:SDR family oxidoreductase [Rhodophyticola sp. MJ-SS7]MDU8946235.1 SDR family oxidoreductase [Rhodophyticola sp. MJ-SS7]
MDDRARKTALITGASSGIGRAFAEEYARRGLDLVLVARRAAPLQDVAEMLRKRNGIAAHVFPADLADPATPDHLFDHLSAQNLEVDVLVNNAGFGVPGNLIDVDWSRHKDTIEVMAAAPVHLCHVFAPRMLSRGSGRVINVSSLSAYLPPHAGGTLYYPVKSYLLQFSLALRAELKGQGVHVTALCPGFTHTGFQAAAGGTVESVAVPKWLWSASSDVARAAMGAVEKNKPVCIPGAFNKTVAAFFKITPAPLGRFFVGG